MIIESVEVGVFQANCYVIAERPSGQAIIIDPGDQERKIRKVLDAHNLTGGLVINTHGHIDHIRCNDAFGVPVYVHRLDLPMLKDCRLNLSGMFGAEYSTAAEAKAVTDGDTISLGSLKLKVLHIPGHTPGGIALLLEKPSPGAVFTGDSLFYRSIGRTDFPGAHEDALLTAIKDKLLSLPDATIVYPGHGIPTTIGDEKRENPFLHV
ncbi:MAG TPA: MBL fold metallo-hydrolase [Patescibacteria group bacterium]|nr:MBL fold metallo-hydrolase [Patescibacteria group bacterium]